MSLNCGVLLAGLVAVAWQLASGEDADSEFTVKRQEVFEFTAPPTVRREGDRVTLTFEAKSFCDATVAIEDLGPSTDSTGSPQAGSGQAGKIVRHLASGVLGPNAPEPLQKNSLKQTLVWNGKDDQGKYLDNPDALTVRVSLGLKPQFERTLFWSPHKRICNNAPLLCAAPEGVYVYEGQGMDFIRLFDHDGRYLRTVYPFPAGKIDAVQGLQRQWMPQSGKELPLKLGFTQTTLLSSARGLGVDNGGFTLGGYAAAGMAVKDGRIAIAYTSLNRFATDGTSGGLPIQGPKTYLESKGGADARRVGPSSLAFSPDGKVLYLTGYTWKTETLGAGGDTFHAVLKMDYAGTKEPELFAGTLKPENTFGADNASFCVPLSVDCDAQGRVYVADYGNNRIQVFSPEGKYLKSLPCSLPSKVSVDPKTQEIAAFSWQALGVSHPVQRERNTKALSPAKTTLTRLGTFDAPKAGTPQELALGRAVVSGAWSESGGPLYQTAWDTFTTPSKVWSAGREATLSLGEKAHHGGQFLPSDIAWDQKGIRMLEEKEGRWTERMDFAAEAKKAVVRIAPEDFGRQRLYLNPADRMLYVGEEGYKSFDLMIRIDPATGKSERFNLPFDAEDACFDRNGLLYLRTDTEVLRYDPQTWREVPWDYGEEMSNVRFAGTYGGSSGRAGQAVSGLPIPGGRPGWWHLSGMNVNGKGHLAVACNIMDKRPARKSMADEQRTMGDLAKAAGKKYTTRQYPGRAGQCVIPIWDRHGKLLHEDPVPGVIAADGIALDDDDNCYVLLTGSRILNGKPYFDEKSETLAKFKPNAGKLIGDAGASPTNPLPLTPEARPKRAPDLRNYAMGQVWADGAEWLYGGVSHGGQTFSGCCCWHGRFALDFLGRSFVPEVMHFSVGVLDSNGNLIVRVGRYGNVDDGKPLDPAGGPPQTNSMGGDEIGLVHACYVGTDTDRRLFISDAGNGRILSVKLGYHTEVKLPLREAAKNLGK